MKPTHITTNSHNDVKVRFSFDVEFCGNLYFVVYGESNNGFFCAIPSHNMACGMSNPYNINTEMGS